MIAVTRIKKQPDLLVLASGLLIGALIIAIQILEYPADYFRYPVPRGQVLYVLSKMAGSCALFFLGIQLILGLLARQREYLKLHRLLGATLFFVVLLHVSTFVAAVSTRSGHLALGLLVPQFSEGFYRSMVSVGALAFWGLCLVVATGFLRVKGGKFATWLHWLSTPLFLGVSLHALQIGTETRYGLIQYIYITEIIAILMAIGWRLSQLHRPYRVEIRAKKESF